MKIEDLFPFRTNSFDKTSYLMKNIQLDLVGGTADAVPPDEYFWRNINTTEKLFLKSIGRSQN